MVPGAGSQSFTGCNPKRFHGAQEIRPLLLPLGLLQLALMSKHYPAWRVARAELNELPLAAEAWKE